MAADDRKASGAFYTPQPLVEHVTALALREILVSRRIPDDVVAAALHGEPVAPAWRATLAAHCEDLRLLDPACGSGAFLVHALERLSSLRARLGDARTTADLRRETLARSIFGVDVNPTAVWLCELRLWLSVVIESDESDPLRVPALPNLDRQVRAGDALLGGAFDAGDARAGRRVAALRARYARATGARKVALLRRLDAEERARAIDVLDRALARVRGERREIVLLGRARDLFGHRSGAGSRDTRRLRELRARGADLRRRRDALTDGGALPFLFGAHFADVAARGGFDVALGNPPWVRPHKLSAATRVALRREFRVARDAGWSGRDACGAGRGFASQTDLSALFVERSLSLLRPGGACALLLPAKLWRSLSGGGVRRLLSERARVTCLEDWSDAPATFDAAVYPSILVARRETSPRGNALDGNHGSHPGLVVAIRDRGGERRWRTGAASLALDGDAASPWLLAPPAARAAFDRLAAAGVALADSPIGRPLLGVKCGANDAFTVTVEALDGATAIVSAGGAATRREGRVERCLLRPLLRGEDVRPWRATPGAMLVWTHDADGHPLASLPRHAADWLAPWRARLAARSDARGRRRWWSLFRTDAAAHDRPRVVWCDVGRAPRAAVLDAGDDTVPLNSCYVARCPSLDDAHALAALLNGPLAAAWLALVAEPARGGYRRFLGWTMSLFPLPRDWTRAVQLLAPLGRQGADGRAPSAAGLLDAALAAYALDHACVAALLEDVPPPDD
jgi:hypothetical protein